MDIFSRRYLFHPLEDVLIECVRLTTGGLINAVIVVIKRNDSVSSS